VDKYESEINQVAGIMTDNTAVQKGGHSNSATNQTVWKWCNSKPEKVFNALIEGKSIRTLAKEIGISRSAMHAWLLRQEPKWADIVADSIMVETIEVADTEEDTTRAKTMCNVRQFALERRFPKQYGRTDKVEITTNDITNRLASGRKRLSNVIDAETVETKAIE